MSYSLPRTFAPTESSDRRLANRVGQTTSPIIAVRPSPGSAGQMSWTNVGRFPRVGVQDIGPALPGEGRAAMRADVRLSDSVCNSFVDQTLYDVPLDVSSTQPVRRPPRAICSLQSLNNSSVVYSRPLSSILNVAASLLPCIIR